MSTIQQSSRALDRTLGVWFQNIHQGMVKRPRFRGFEPWDPVRIASFINTIMKYLPVGSTLTLDIAGRHKFASRYVARGDPIASSKGTQQLLDGHQRFAAFLYSVRALSGAARI